jgi:outer membrane protein with beta-barrel domain
MLMGAIALLVLTAAPAKAQNMWVSGGYTAQQWGSGGNWNDAQGYGLDFGYKIHKTSKTAGAAFVDFSQNQWDKNIVDEKDTSIVGGFREIFFTNKMIQPFAHASIGDLHWMVNNPDFSGNDLILGGGAGVQVNFHKNVGAKAQWDFWKPREDGEWSDPIYRWTFAVVYMWGGK